MTRKTQKAYAPKRYFAGLSKTKKAQRKREIAKFGALNYRDPAAYVGFKTDKDVNTGTHGPGAARTKPSSYTEGWHALFPDAKSLAAKSKASGVPLRYIQASFNRGMAAWRTGHRPGASQQAWGYARVHSFLLGGKTFHTTDSDLARAAMEHSAKAKAWWSSLK